MNKDNKENKEFGSFAEIFENMSGGNTSLEGRVVKGTIVGIRGDVAVIDVGFKSEGRVSLKEIQSENIQVGDTIDVYLERIEDRHGEAVLSVEKARREFLWQHLESSCETGTSVDGSIFGKVKGGFAVDLSGAIAFLPGSQVDLRPVRDIKGLVNIVQPFKILKMDRMRNNIVVSRRAVLEEVRAEARTELVSKLSEGEVVKGTVKNITEYGAFVDLGGIDGLLHVTDISWKRINHPSEALNVGDQIDVQILRFNKETHRISLGLKQVGPDPWKDVTEYYIVGQRYKGKVVNLADYGAFIELEHGIEGIVYLSDMSWIKKNIHPSKVLEVGQDVEVLAIEVDPEKRRLTLGLKQCQENPWSKFKEERPVGTVVDGTTRNITEFGVFVAVADDLDGMVHLSDVSWDDDLDKAVSKYKKGDSIKVKILSIDPDRERIGLGIKQVAGDPFEEGVANIKKGDVVKGKITAVSDRSFDVALNDAINGVVRKNDFSRDRVNQKSDRFQVGEEIEAKVVSVDRSIRRVVLSIKALEIDEGKAALSELGDQGSSSAFGELLSEAMKEKESKKLS